MKQIHRILALPFLISSLLLATAEATTPQQTEEELTITHLSGPTECDAKDKVIPGKYVMIHYIGTISDMSAVGAPGHEFDNSYKRDLPFSFRLGTTNLMKGLEKGVDGLCKDSITELVVPPSWGYGPTGPVSADATLDFVLEVLGVSKTEFSEEDILQASSVANPDSDRIAGENEFILLDMDGDGMITKEEMKVYYEAIGRDDFESIEEVFEIEDKDGDGSISWDEFPGPKGDAPPEYYQANNSQDFELREAGNGKPNQFAEIDTNDDGVVCKDELEAYYKSINLRDVDVDEIVKGDDIDNDGCISWDEFSGTKGNRPSRIAEEAPTDSPDDEWEWVDDAAVGEQDDDNDEWEWEYEDAEGHLLGVNGTNTTDDEWEYVDDAVVGEQDDDNDEFEYVYEDAEGHIIDSEGHIIASDRNDIPGEDEEDEDEDEDLDDDILDDEYEWVYVDDDGLNSTETDADTESSGLRGSVQLAAAPEDNMDMFHEIDTNNDDLISHEEYVAYFASMNMEDADVDEIILMQDLDGDGFVSWEEYPGPKGQKAIEEEDTF